MAGIGRGKVFADGQLANAKATLYTVPTDKVAYVKFLSVHNTTGGALTVTIYVNTSGTSRVIYSASLAASTSAQVIGAAALVLEGGDIIEGAASAATSIDYVITGIEES